MAWDYAEVNPFGDSGGVWHRCFERVSDAIVSLPARIKGSRNSLMRRGFWW